MAHSVGHGNRSGLESRNAEQRRVHVPGFADGDERRLDAQFRLRIVARFAKRNPKRLPFVKFEKFERSLNVHGCLC